jgi:hypothetical protein
MKIWTSRYGNKELAANPSCKLGITVGKPRWGVPYEMTWCPQLGPDRTYLHTAKEKYEPQYLAKLDALGIEHVMDIINRCSAVYGGADVILLCFEDLRKEGEWCHRRMLAEWIERHTGIMVEELPEAEAKKSPAVVQTLLF